MFLVDTVSVDPARVDEYVEVLRTRVVPLMTGAGAAYESCRVTAAGIGEPVEVQVTWSFADLVAWNAIRCALVVDPRYYECAASLASLRTGGTRRFLEPVPAMHQADPG